MPSRLSVLFASTVLTVALALPALAAMQAQDNAQSGCSGVCVAVFNADGQPVPLIRVSGDDDDDDDGGWVRPGTRTTTRTATTTTTTTMMMMTTTAPALLATVPLQAPSHPRQMGFSATARRPWL